MINSLRNCTQNEKRCLQRVITKQVFLSVIVIAWFSTFKLLAQNYVSVPFGNGFVGVNGGNSVSNNSYYLSGASGIGWSNLQFAQATTSTVFVTQGNDIVGFVQITDFNGVQHTIDGFIKWRTPSGNNPHTMVFQPSTGPHVLATNGAYGINSYTIDPNKYIGLTELGQVLTISPVPGTVSGNASTSGLLDALNEMYTSLPKLSITGVSVLESEGIAFVAVALDAVSSNVITVNISSEDVTAIDGDDYTMVDTNLTFAPGELSKTIGIPIVVDAIPELSEYFYIALKDATNASVSKSLDSVIILDAALPVEFLGMTYSCLAGGGQIDWSVSSEKDAAFYTVESSDDGVNWTTEATVDAHGTSNVHIDYTATVRSEDEHQIYYYRLFQTDINGSEHYLGEIAANGCKGQAELIVYPIPAEEKLNLSLQASSEDDYTVELIEPTGKIVYSDRFNLNSDIYLFTIDVSEMKSGSYYLVVSSNGKVLRQRLSIL